MWLLSWYPLHSHYRLTEFLDHGTVPRYAILSHTWLKAGEDEPTFKDLQEGLGQEKPGYKKIEFCGEQARRDELEYFWVDTCCINKENRSELSYAIRSMFRWYRNSDRCYVYMSDVSDSEHSIIPTSWASEFDRSRWFTRGWTLQELLAPRIVEFYSSECVLLGSKILLAEHISEITRISRSALNGHTLSRFSREERFGWSSSRETSRPEDKAYSLLGIFGVDMPVVYDEGAGGAFRRLEEAIERQNRCIRDIRLSDPRDDKKRIEENKGGLLKDAYCWILQTIEFQQWRSAEHSSILWIKGDPGKGKTMLLCGIIDELEECSGKMPVLSYFFCQATDRRADNAAAVFRGLIFMFVHQWPSLVSHFQAEYDTAGKSLFEDVNAWVALSRILRSILQDPMVDGAHVIVDALDECATDQQKLLDFIVVGLPPGSHIKWIVSSRNWLNIERAIGSAKQAIKLSLELNEKSVSAAVTIYIHLKVTELAQRNDYNTAEQEAVQRNLEHSAQDTFLWVALVCQELLDVPGWEASSLSQEYPAGLEPLYSRMIEQISRSRRSKLCKEVLAVASVAQRPLALEEMSSLVTGGPPSSAFSAWTDIMKECGSFLTLRESVIYFVHQSAKDFLVSKASHHIYPYGVEHVHHSVCTQAIDLLMKNLRRDIYSLKDPGSSIDEVTPPRSFDPLAALRYCCVHWIEHLQEVRAVSNSNLFHSNGLVDKFLRECYLYWLEASSLCGSMSDAQSSMLKLESLLQEKGSVELLSLARDARRFVMYHKVAIERFPLQTYMSALLFSPRQSLIRKIYDYEAPNFVTVMPLIGDEWGACLQTLEGHSDSVESVAFSHDSNRLASASLDRTVKIWNASSGACLQTLEGHNDSVLLLAFSYDSNRLASASCDRTIRIWDANDGACLQTLEGHSGPVESVAFSHDSDRLASASYDGTVKIWDANRGACLQTLKNHGNPVTSGIFRQPQSLQSQSMGLSLDRKWLTKQSNNLLWLPSEYRPFDSAMVAMKAGIGTLSGKVWICRYNDLG
ncbi:hypothetical protein LTR95_013958 [Oleoguttula sp. CCFEE 5521]